MSMVTKLEDFCRVLESSGCKWICFKRTEKPDSIVIGVSNAVDVWQQNITHGSTSTATDTTKLRSADIKLSVNDDTVTLTLGSAGERYSLQKVSDDIRSTELAASFFAVAERCAEVERRLIEAEQNVESLKRSAATGASAHLSIFDMTVDSKKKKVQPKIQPKQAGMSIVNPGSRRRAKAKGVEFE